ncbi:MAG: hypothetical protein ACRDI2_02045, partial [Chloroflexota bacterium]
GCVEQWGGEVVRDWYWCIWNEPNNDRIGGGLAFDQYHAIYREVAQTLLRWLAPYLAGHPPRIGGPAVDGFQPFWLDWIRQFVHDVDPALVGFTSWHRYGDWRTNGEWLAPADDAAFCSLLLAQTPDYEARARTVARLLAKRDVRNICGELNAHSHHDPRVSRRFNQSVFGAAYYASALIHLIRGGADVEMLWTGTDDTGPYGLLDKHGHPTPVFHAKRLCASYVRFGDWVSFPEPVVTDDGSAGPDLDVLVARSDTGRRSALLVHLRDARATYLLGRWGGAVPQEGILLKLDRGSGGVVTEMEAGERITFDGYGVAVVTSERVSDAPGDSDWPAPPGAPSGAAGAVSERGGARRGREGRG